MGAVHNQDGSKATEKRLKWGKGHKIPMYMPLFQPGRILPPNQAVHPRPLVQQA